MSTEETKDREITLPETKASKALNERFKRAASLFGGDKITAKKPKISKSTGEALIDELFKEKEAEVHANFKKIISEALDENTKLNKLIKDGIQKLSAELDKQREELSKKLDGAFNMLEQAKQDKAETEELLGGTPEA